MPPMPTIVAEQNARFHCPTILTPWYVSDAGTFAFDAPTKRKAPKYRTEGLVAKPRMAIPTISIVALNISTGPRMLYLSDHQDWVRPRMAPKA